MTAFYYKENRGQIFRWITRYAHRDSPNLAPAKILSSMQLHSGMSSESPRKDKNISFIDISAIDLHQIGIVLSKSVKWCLCEYRDLVWILFT